MAYEQTEGFDFLGGLHGGGYSAHDDGLTDGTVQSSPTTTLPHADWPLDSQSSEDSGTQSNNAQGHSAGSTYTQADFEHNNLERLVLLSTSDYNAQVAPGLDAFDMLAGSGVSQGITDHHNPSDAQWVTEQHGPSVDHVIAQSVIQQGDAVDESAAPEAQIAHLLNEAPVHAYGAYPSDLLYHPTEDAQVSAALPGYVANDSELSTTTAIGPFSYGPDTDVLAQYSSYQGEYPPSSHTPYLPQPVIQHDQSLYLPVLPHLPVLGPEEEFAQLNAFDAAQAPYPPNALNFNSVPPSANPAQVALPPPVDSADPSPSLPGSGSDLPRLPCSDSERDPSSDVSTPPLASTSCRKGKSVKRKRTQADLRETRSPGDDTKRRAPRRKRARFLQYVQDAGAESAFGCWTITTPPIVAAPSLTSSSSSPSSTRSPSAEQQLAFVNPNGIHARCPWNVGEGQEKIPCGAVINGSDMVEFINALHAHIYGEHPPNTHHKGIYKRDVCGACLSTTTECGALFTPNRPSLRHLAVHVAQTHLTMDVDKNLRFA